MRMSVRSGYPGETEYLRRKNSRIIAREKRIRTIRLRGLHVLLILLSLALAAFFAYKVALFVLTWDKLNVKEFVLYEKPFFKLAEVEKTLKAYKGNILTLSLAELRADLLRFNEIKEVSITRQLPSTIVVQFYLRKPVFQVTINGKYNIMDTDGVILGTSSSFNTNLINIQGITRSNLSDIVPYLPELGRIKKSLEYVTILKPYGIALKLNGRKELFYPGESNFAAKINEYLELYRHPLVSKYEILSVDLRFDGRFYFEYANYETNNLNQTNETEAKD